MQTLHEYLSETLRGLAASEAEAEAAIRMMEKELPEWAAQVPAELVKEQFEDEMRPWLTLARQRRNQMRGGSLN